MKALNQLLFVGVASATLSVSCIGPCVAASPGSPLPPIPPVGSQAWAVVLCKFSDQPGQPHDVQWYRDFATRPVPNKDGLWNYWYDVSYGQMDLTGSMVFGWNTLPHPLSYYADKDHKNFPS